MNTFATSKSVVSLSQVRSQYSVNRLPHPARSSVYERPRAHNKYYNPHYDRRLAAHSNKCYLCLFAKFCKPCFLTSHLTHKALNNTYIKYTLDTL